MTVEADVFGALKYRIVVDEDGTRRYHNSAGDLHREEGPAVIFTDGGHAWFYSGELHRIDGPAVKYTDGYVAWWQNGKLHRTDGPAVVFS